MADAGIEPMYLHSLCLTSLLSMNAVAPSGRYITATLTGWISLPMSASMGAATFGLPASMIVCWTPVTAAQSMEDSPTGSAGMVLASDRAASRSLTSAGWRYSGAIWILGSICTAAM